MAAPVPQRSGPDIEELRKFYVGKDINEVPKPAVVLDRAKMRRHCQSLLSAVDSLGVGFRAHIKTHKVCKNETPSLLSKRFVCWGSLLIFKTSKRLEKASACKLEKQVKTSSS